MNCKKIAAIDIGSNAVRLLIVSVEEELFGPFFKKVLLLRIPLRLGEDSFSIGKISDARAHKLNKVMRAFKLLMDVHEVTNYKAYATAAMREAKNGRKVAEKIKEKTTIKVEIIDGSVEARIIYDSNIIDQLDPNKNYLYVDVGGGSTELSIIVKGELAESKSFNIGTIRMLRGKVTNEEKESMKQFLAEVKEKHAPEEIIGSGGNINKLHRLAKLNKEETLTLNKLDQLYQKLKALSLDDRMDKYKLNPDRADVIVPASEIFIEIASLTGIQKIYVPTFGLVDGIVRKLYLSIKNTVTTY